MCLEIQFSHQVLGRYVAKAIILFKAFFLKKEFAFQFICHNSMKSEFKETIQYLNYLVKKDCSQFCLRAG